MVRWARAIGGGAASSQRLGYWEFSEDAGDDVLGGDLFRIGFEAGDDAVSQDVSRHGFHVVRGDEASSAEVGVGAGC